jgi:hypothetical protein
MSAARSASKKVLGSSGMWKKGARKAVTQGCQAASMGSNSTSANEVAIGQRSERNINIKT